ncbi:MAG: hypothetical protein ACI8Z7_000726 [Candidatus Nanohaloarchaea archaeon]|jgi:hypothetical protein
MSVSQEYGLLHEENFEFEYEDFVRDRAEDGPVSLRQLRQELENEIRYDGFTDPEEAQLEDSIELVEAFENVRDRNSNGELEGELAVSYSDGEMYIRFMDDRELLRYEMDTEPYRIDE